jgi:DNA invertase Pin-like site-specific DNA recombinase
MNINQALLEAVDRLNKLDKEFQEARQDVADLLKKAAETQQVTNLARMTGINRATIYWLMNTWSRNADTNNGNHSRKSA